MEDLEEDIFRTNFFYRILCFTCEYTTFDYSL